jgi:serine phosphatase RsbU (regulator of sigma subunit)
LQAKLEERTKEVVQQKELLEVKNKDITSSIEYAKNIQKAMLPAPDKLNQLFRDAFVYYKPRDIVSGDFYWAERFGNKTILACADCTGHGVPGAFMSLIGSALLKEVCNMKAIHSPEDALHALDKELRAMVNKSDSEFGIADGMDIAIVEFDHDRNLLRCSGARRPVVVYRNGERIELRGDRKSIGGDQEGESGFTVHSIELQHGDSFYMFSDGVSDQFGGEKGKKLKKTGVLRILDNLNGKAMSTQKTIVDEKFSNWMGDHIQVDDIILLGVRI